MNKYKKLFHSLKSWLFGSRITFATKAAFSCKLVFCLGFLLISLNINASVVSKSLTITAVIIKNEQADALRIEAEQYNFLSTYSSALGTFNPIKIPFKVYSNQRYKLEATQFSFRCKSEAESHWVDKINTLDVYFDKTPLPFEQTNKTMGLNLPDIDYLKPDLGGDNVRENPYSNEGWDAWYREHQFDIVQTTLPQREDDRNCLGQLAVIATTVI